MFKATVIGSGPNGLTAAIVLARAGVRVTVLEGQTTIGGGIRSLELTMPGFIHDLCSAVHPLGIASPIFSDFPLAAHGLEWIHSPSPLAHPFDDGTALTLERNLSETRAAWGQDGDTYARIVQPFVDHWEDLLDDVLAPARFPHHPLLYAQFGRRAILPASWSAKGAFKSDKVRALFAGIAAHSLLPLESVGSSAIAWVLALAGHAGGWPIPRGGSRSIAAALKSYLESLGGEVITAQSVESIDELSDSDIVMADLSPRQLLKIARHRLPEAYAQQLVAFRYGPGVFKMDWALRAPIPWRAKECGRAATVHLGGSLEEICESERAPERGTVSEKPFVLLAQPSLFDNTRAPAGQHTAWAYCHVPNGFTAEASELIENQIERFAPGFKSVVLDRHFMGPAELEKHNPNLIGGDISGGLQNLRQLFFRPTRHLYRTPLKGLYLCSASTPPGGGVHGMCGYHAARMALKDFSL